MIFDWLLKKKLGEFPSKYNGTIEVYSEMGEKYVLVNGVEQSGFLVREIWEKALKEVLLGPQEDLLRNVLILGLGCGSVTKPLRQKFPNCQITGVEIDPVMIKIGKKYFGLDKIPNLKIICVDARSCVRECRGKFDLVLIDTYVGRVFKGGRVNFKKFASKNGVILLNKIVGQKNVVISV